MGLGNGIGRVGVRRVVSDRVGRLEVGPCGRVGWVEVDKGSAYL